MPSITITATGSPSATLNRSGSLPAGVTATKTTSGNSTTIVIAGTPTAGGLFTDTFTSSNGAGSATPQTLTLTVNAGPNITSGATGTATVGTPYSFTFRATGYPAPQLTESGALPQGVTFTQGAGTATLTGTPAAGTGGVYVLTITAANATSMVTKAFTLTVRQAPVITSASSVTFNRGTAQTFAITATGYPVPTLSRTGTLPSGLRFTNNGNGTATLSGTAGATSAGTYTWTITARNAAATVTQTLTITVT
jgi:hypothetical protein